MFLKARLDKPESRSFRREEQVAKQGGVALPFFFLLSLLCHFLVSFPSLVNTSSFSLFLGFPLTKWANDEAEAMKW